MCHSVRKSQCLVLMCVRASVLRWYIGASVLCCHWTSRDVTAALRLNYFCIKSKHFVLLSLHALTSLSLVFILTHRVSSVRDNLRLPSSLVLSNIHLRYICAWDLCLRFHFSFSLFKSGKLVSQTFHYLRVGMIEIRCAFTSKRRQAMNFLPIKCTVLLKERLTS